jgi:ubiquinone/menaquinone biosynthesis C-methylase UbiE
MKMPKTNHLQYTKGAKDYDDKEQDRNYFFEVEWLRDRINEVKKSKGNHLLDVGCGTGTHLKYLQDDYVCTGFDLHQEMIHVAKRKLKKNVTLFQASMVDFNLEKEFDVIISLYSVINYAKDFKEFRKVLKNIYRHLKKGGVCIIEPYYTKQIYEHDRNKPYPKHLLVHEVWKWSKIMREVGFNVTYNYSGLNQKAKGAYVLTK